MIVTPHLKLFPDRTLSEIECDSLNFLASTTATALGPLLGLELRDVIGRPRVSSGRFGHLCMGMARRPFRFGGFFQRTFSRVAPRWIFGTIAWALWGGSLAAGVASTCGGLRVSDLTSPDEKETGYPLFGILFYITARGGLVSVVSQTVASGFILCLSPFGFGFFKPYFAGLILATGFDVARNLAYIQSRQIV